MPGTPRVIVEKEPPESRVPPEFGRPLQILLVEDNPGDARLLREHLEELPALECRLTEVRTRADALDALANPDAFDLVFLDLDLPDSEGLDTVRPVVVAAAPPPVVVLTGHQDVRVASEALIEGVQDYLVKARVGPVDLTRAIRTALERARVERELRRSEARFRQMAENIEEVFYLLDAAHRPPEVLYVNPAFRDLFGLPVERVYHDPTAWRELVHPNDRDRVAGAVDQVQSEGSFDLRYRIVRPDGETRWMHARGFPVDDEADTVSRIAGITRDVTHSILLRQSLEEERAQLEQIIEGAPAFMALYLGPDHVLETANEAWFELVGDRNAVGRPAREIFPEFATQPNLDRLDRVFETGEPIQLDQDRVELRRGDGGPTRDRFLRIAYQPRIKDGEVVGVIVHGVDVTETVRAHREARARKESLEAILETTAEGILFTGSDGHIQYANPAAREILGMDADELHGRHLTADDWGVRDLDGNPIVGEDLPAYRALEHGERVEGTDMVFDRRDGRELVLSVNAAPHRDEEGNPTGAVVSFRDVTEQKGLQREIRHQALHDHLTGLPNRALFRDRLEQALNRARRTGEGFALAYLDLKRFKVLNDSLGHAAGDRVLVEIASRLQAAVSENDTVARAGGDEFTILFSRVASRSEARRGGERIVEAFADPVELDGSSVPVDATVGLALCLDGEIAGSADPTALIRRADDASFQAEDRPGTAYAVAEPETQSDGPDRMERERELRAALEDNDLHTVYQPIFDSRGRRVVAVEALARWEHPDRGSVSPGEFIPLAEETGLITRLGEQQLAEACRVVGTLGGGRGRGDGNIHLHVNLSARQLLDPDVVERVEAVLRETGFPPERLTLEITETAAMRKPGAVQELRATGVGISLDDFGTEYSSLAQLKQLQVDGLKIDRSFVVGLPGEREDRAIVETVLTLGGALDLKVIAEGVETAEQFTALRDAGCPFFQGFLLSRPLPADGLAELLEGTARADRAWGL